MRMSRSEEREVFLKYLASIFSQNPNLTINLDVIYSSLIRFFTFNNKPYFINHDSLVGVQVALNNKYSSKAITFVSPDGNFWCIENRNSKSDNDYMTSICNGIKLYVSVDSDIIYKIADLLFDFMLKENIVMQCKISKIMRNDALGCRVSKSEEAFKVMEYLNSLNYKSNVRPNPFLFENGNVSVTRDGALSYNSTLSKLLCEYFNIKKSSNALSYVSCADFNKFIKNKLKYLRGNPDKSFMDLYNIDSEESLKYFIMIVNIIAKNLDGNMSLDELFRYQNIEEINIKFGNRSYSSFDEDKILCVINRLVNSDKYSVQDAHNIIMEFIKTGNYNLFSRRDDRGEEIRSIVYDNFTSEDVKNIVSILGWKALISAAVATYDKYGEEQLHEAVKNVFNNKGINLFTNDHGVRSCLGLIIPDKLLREVITSKLIEKGQSVSENSFMDLVLEEVNERCQKRVTGRK